MQNFQQVIARLRVRYSILISAEKETFLKALFEAYTRSEEVDLQKHLSFAFEERQCEVIIREFENCSTSKEQPAKSEPKEESPSFKRKYSQIQETPKKRNHSSTEPNSPAKPLKGKEESKTQSSNRSDEPPSAKLKQQRVKCRFYPFCERGESCLFYHPTVKCMYFPKCREGSSCLFKHDLCKYDERCTRIDCCYDHRFRPKHLQSMNALFKVSRLLLSNQRKEMIDGDEENSD